MVRLRGIVLAALLLSLPARAAADPVINLVLPSFGPETGGTAVFISGSGFSGDSTVTFGGAAAAIAFIFENGTGINVTTPVHAPGVVDVVVVNSGGTATKTGAFQYAAVNGPAPTVSSVEIAGGLPAKGTTLGGTAITVTGTNFRQTGDGSNGGATANARVLIHGRDATSVTVVNSTTITAVTPPSSGGVSYVVPGVAVANSDGTSGSLPNSFTYKALCDAQITVNCISELTIDPAGPALAGPPPAGIEALLMATAYSPANNIQITIVNNNHSGTEIFELAPDVTAADTIRVVLKLQPDWSPVLAMSTGDIQNQGFRWDGSSAILVYTPQQTSWNRDFGPGGGCQLPPGSCAAQATDDYDALAYFLMEMGSGLPPALQDDLQGVFLSTNAQVFTAPPTYDAEDGAFNFQVGSPHLKASGAVNDGGFFNFFISDTFAANQWGITDTSVLVSDPGQLAVTIGGSQITPTITDVAAAGDGSSLAGVKIEFHGFHYSVENIAIIIAPTVTGIAPAGGPIAGGTPVTITGLNFRPGATVTIGGAPATHVVVVNSTTITAKTGAHAAGVTSVVVTNSDTTHDTLAASFTFNPPMASLVADTDGDGKTDLAIFRPSTGDWYIRSSSTNYTTSTTRQFGLPGDVPVPGDYDGDGQMDLAVYRPSNGTWYVLQSTTSTPVSYQWGLIADIPAPGDYDGDGKAEPAVYRPSTGTWYILTSSSNFTAFTSVQWGLRGDVPAPGDYDGDSKTDPTVYRPSNGTWYTLTSSSSYAASRTIQWGLTGDIPVPGYYDEDGVADLAVYRPSIGMWFILQSTTDFATPVSYQWGLSGDVPVPSDYDGDGKTDLAVYRPPSGTWYIALSTTGYATSASLQWGLSDDVPAPNAPTAYAMAGRPTRLASRASVSDFDGDGKSDLTRFTIGGGTGRPGIFTALLSSTNSTTSAVFISATGAVTVPHDYDGDGRADFAIAQINTWRIQRSTTGLTTTHAWGPSDPEPHTEQQVPADYDGDGLGDLAVYVEPGGLWRILLSSTNSQATLQWGLDGDRPLSGDFDGDTTSDLVVFRPSTSTWFIRYSSTGFATFASYQWGLAGDITVPGDYDGDGKTDVAVFRPSNGVWYILKSSTNFTEAVTHQWGLGGTPVPGDYDGDGKTDIAVKRFLTTSSSTWLILKSRTNFTAYDVVEW